MADLITAEDVHKTYTIGKTVLPVLRGASLSVAAGESMAIVGVSGAGKSTLLHIVGGIDRPDRGRVVFDDTDLYAVSSSRRTRLRATAIGFVFQTYHLLPEMDVIENVMLPAMAVSPRRTNGLDIRSGAMELLRAVGLDGRAKHRPMELSGGEQQRVALARALMNDPAVVLADEPTGNLDTGTGGQVLAYLFNLVQDRKHTLLLVTHNRDVASNCDRVATLAEGVLLCN